MISIDHREFRVLKTQIQALWAWVHLPWQWSPLLRGFMETWVGDRWTVFKLPWLQCQPSVRLNFLITRMRIVLGSCRFFKIRSVIISSSPCATFFFFFFHCTIFLFPARIISYCTFASSSALHQIYIIVSKLWYAVLDSSNQTYGWSNKAIITAAMEWLQGNYSPAWQIGIENSRSRRVLSPLSVTIEEKKKKKRSGVVVSGENYERKYA